MDMSTTARNSGGSQYRRKAPIGPIQRRWYTVPEVAEMLGYGPTKVRMMCISGDLRSLKDGGSRRILPAWVDEYVAMRAAQAEADWP
jgi:excisionase family DNA binding protein